MGAGFAMASFRFNYPFLKEGGIYFGASFDEYLNLVGGALVGFGILVVLYL